MVLLRGLQGTVWPETLQCLSFGAKFNQSLQGVTLCGKYVWAWGWFECLTCVDCMKNTLLGGALMYIYLFIFLLLGKQVPTIPGKALNYIPTTPFIPVATIGTGFFASISWGKPRKKSNKTWEYSTYNPYSHQLVGFFGFHFVWTSHFAFIWFCLRCFFPPCLALQMAAFQVFLFLLFVGELLEQIQA